MSKFGIGKSCTTSSLGQHFLIRIQMYDCRRQRLPWHSTISSALNSAKRSSKSKASNRISSRRSSEGSTWSMLRKETRLQSARVRLVRTLGKRGDKQAEVHSAGNKIGELHLGRLHRRGSPILVLGRVWNKSLRQMSSGRPHLTEIGSKIRDERCEYERDHYYT